MQREPPASLGFTRGRWRGARPLLTPKLHAFCCPASRNDPHCRPFGRSVQLVFDRQPGVTKTLVGYSQGTLCCAATAAAACGCTLKWGADAPSLSCRPHGAPSLQGGVHRLIRPRRGALPAEPSRATTASLSKRSQVVLVEYDPKVRLLSRRGVKREGGGAHASAHDCSRATRSPVQVITFEKLLSVFTNKINVTQFEGQGNDHGSQYRTGVCA